jgi:hypothetical protein
MGHPKQGGAKDDGKDDAQDEEEEIKGDTSGLIGHFQWIFPDARMSGKPIVIGEPVVFKWTFTDEVRNFPKSVSLDLIHKPPKKERTAMTIVKETPGVTSEKNGRSFGEYKWTPDEDIPTGLHYHIYIYDSEVDSKGLEAGGAQGLFSAGFGIREQSDPTTRKLPLKMASQCF